MKRVLAWIREHGLANADLQGVDLNGAYLRGADLTRADLGSARLPYAKLNDADLTGVNFAGATFDNAELQYAELGRAQLDDGTLTEAEMARFLAALYHAADTDMGPPPARRNVLNRLGIVRENPRPLRRSPMKASSRPHSAIAQMSVAGGELPDALIAQRRISILISHPPTRLRPIPSVRSTGRLPVSANTRPNALVMTGSGDSVSGARQIARQKVIVANHVLGYPTVPASSFPG